MDTILVRLSSKRDRMSIVYMQLGQLALPVLGQITCWVGLLQVIMFLIH